MPMPACSMPAVLAGNTLGYQQVAVWMKNSLQHALHRCQQRNLRWQLVQQHPTKLASAPGNARAKYGGCYSDAANRALPVVLSQSDATRKSCVAAARARGLLYAGLQYGGHALPATPSAIKRPNRPMKAQLAA